MEFLSSLHLNDVSTSELKTINYHRSVISARKLKSISQKLVSERMQVDPRAVNKFEMRYANFTSGDFEKAYCKAVEELLNELAEGATNE